MTGPKVAIVEDDVLIAMYLSDVVEDTGGTVCGLAHDPDAAERLIRAERPDYVLMDVRLGHARDGVDVALSIYDDLPDTRVVYVTGSNEPGTIERIKGDHPWRIILKPADPTQIAEALSGVPAKGQRTLA